MIITLGPAAAALQSRLGWGFPENASVDGGRIDDLFWLMFWVLAPFLVAVAAFVAYCLIRFRAGEGRPASHIKGFRTALGTGVIIAILLAMEVPFDVIQERVWADARAHVPKADDAVQIQVYAEQFAWNFRYPGKDGKFGTADDLTTLNNVRIPVGKPILLTMRSRDVIHSFWLPSFRVKMDVLPGTTHKLWFQAAKAGTYEIGCAELCGLGHYRMRGLLTAVSPEEYERWLKQQAKDLEEDGPGDERKKWDLWDAKP